ncbi:MAG: hypothetical protein NVSMB59_05640 [Vulcanimicrobiaceae bacterium]
MTVGVPAIVQRFAFALLRRFAPILRLGDKTLVTRYLDVVDVLRRDDEFTVAQINGVKMERLDAPFILGFDRGERYDREAAVLHGVVRAHDLGRIASIVAREAEQQTAAARASGRIDVVGGYARVVATRLIGAYFGVTHADPALLATWLRAIFHDIFLNPRDDAAVHARASIANAALGAHIDALVARRRASADRPDDVLSRLLAVAQREAWLDDATLRRNLASLVVATVDNTATFFAKSMAQLLRRPAHAALAREAAIAGDVGTVGRYLSEAGRFDPAAPCLIRHVSRDTELASGTRRRTVVRAGGTLLLATSSAMFDSDGFTEPTAFDIDHAAESLHFGYGLHQCLGRRISAVQLPELGAALLRLGALTPAGGSDGKIAYDGPFPDRFVVKFA